MSEPELKKKSERIDENGNQDESENEKENGNDNKNEWGRERVRVRVRAFEPGWVLGREGWLWVGI